MKSGTVRWAVPGLFAGVPADDGPQVPAFPRQFAGGAVLSPIDRQLMQSPADDRSMPGWDVINRFHIAAREPIGILCRQVDVFRQEGPQRNRHPSRWVIHAGERIIAAADQIRDELCSERGVGHSHSRIPGDDVEIPTPGGRANESKSIGRFKYLTRPVESDFPGYWKRSRVQLTSRAHRSD